MSFPRVFQEGDIFRRIYASGIAVHYMSGWYVEDLRVWLGNTEITNECTAAELERAREQVIRRECNRELDRERAMA